ncbi:aldo/keto reductase [Streptomyces sp. H39-S7]|uniref:aldo/keto reductase n=1 Tax=Streptomyces sp. H39-S7 TaxID=3004357 RepID=UPI0022AEE1E7|nr:aldo/keto reductase [Streptomyces sp. H39-S7]MCZ4123930.1 aldo/keto reductase [Streptomyces sp. H39-S7]
MDHHDMPGLGRKVSRFGAGCWTIGGPAVNNGTPIGWDGVDEDAAYAGLVRAHELGVTVFDTADVYGLGRSERLIGRLLRETTRNNLVISSKVGYFAGTARHPYLPSQIHRQFATTLDNLGTGYLDLYHLHSSDFGDRDTYLQPTIDSVVQLRDRGLIHAIGMRTPHRFALEWADRPSHPHAAETRRFLHLLRSVRPDVLTVRHNLMSPRYSPGETDIFAFARAEGIGVMIKQVLGQGLLLGTRQTGSERTFSASDHRSGKPVDADLLRLLGNAVNQIGRRFGAARQDLARAAVQYALHDAPKAVALIGFRDASQISTTLARANEPITDGDMDFLHAVMSPVREKMTDSQPGTNAHRKN